MTIKFEYTPEDVFDGKVPVQALYEGTLGANIDVFLAKLIEYAKHNYGTISHEQSENAVSFLLCVPDDIFGHNFFEPLLKSDPRHLGSLLGVFLMSWSGLEGCLLKTKFVNYIERVKDRDKKREAEIVEVFSDLKSKTNLGKLDLKFAEKRLLGIF